MRIYQKRTQRLRIGQGLRRDAGGADGARHLACGIVQRQGNGGKGRIALRDFLSGSNAAGSHGYKSKLSRFSRRQFQLELQGGYGIKRQSAAARQRVGSPLWIAQAPIAADKRPAIGFAAQVIHRPLAVDHELQQHRRRLARAARPTVEQHSSHPGKDPRVNEKLAECRVPLILQGWCQHDLRIAGELEAPCRVALIGDCKPANLDIVARSNADFHPQVYSRIAAVEFDHVRIEDHAILIRFGGGRLPGGRPQPAAFLIVEVEPEPVRIARGIAGKASKGGAMPAQRASTSFRNPAREPAVSEQVSLRKTRTRREPARNLNRTAAGLALFLDTFQPFDFRRQFVRNALAQQQ